MSGAELRRLAVRGNVLELRKLLAAGANPCSVDENGLTALHYACWNGHTEAVELLCANSTGRDKRGQLCDSINQQSSIGASALHVAARGGLHAAPIISVLLLNGVDRTLCDEHAQTALMTASENSNEECVTALTAAVSLSAVQAYRRERLPLNVQHTSGQRTKLPACYEMPEESILPISLQQYQKSTNASGVIQSLSKAAQQAELHFERRQKLQQIAAATTAPNNAAH